MNDFREFANIPGFERKATKVPEYYNTSGSERKVVRVPEHYRSFVETYGDSRSNLHKNHNSSTIYNLNYDRLGVLGELAFQLLTNVSMDTSLKLKGDDKDFLIKGYSIDVKASSYQYPRLYVKQRRIKDHYLYVIGYANLDQLVVEFCGWAYGLFLKRDGYIDRSKKEPAYYFESNQLYPIERLPILLKIPFTI